MDPGGIPIQKDQPGQEGCRMLTCHHHGDGDDYDSHKDKVSVTANSHMELVADQTLP